MVCLRWWLHRLGPRLLHLAWLCILSTPTLATATLCVASASSTVASAPTPILRILIERGGLGVKMLVRSRWWRARLHLRAVPVLEPNEPGHFIGHQRVVGPSAATTIVALSDELSREAKRFTILCRG